MNTNEIVKKSTNRIWQKWSIAFKILPLLIIIVALKFLAHRYGWEVMELNALFTSLVAGTIFLIGFLISGVLSDYKESEKMPSEIAASFQTLWDDTYTILNTKDKETATAFIAHQKLILKSMMKWFNRKERTMTLLEMISHMNEFFVKFDTNGVQANYIIKMKNEQNSLRKMVLRIDSIRATNFISPAYAIVESMGVFTAFGLIIMKIEPFYASLFLTSLVTFLIGYMVFLISDIDNPFDYAGHGESGTEVPLKPLHDLEALWKD